MSDSEKMHKKVFSYVFASALVFVIGVSNCIAYVNCEDCCSKVSVVGMGCSQSDCESTCGSQMSGCYYTGVGGVRGCHNCAAGTGDTGVTKCEDYLSDACANDPCGQFGGPGACKLDASNKCTADPCFKIKKTNTCAGYGTDQASCKANTCKIGGGGATLCTTDSSGNCIDNPTVTATTSATATTGGEEPGSDVIAKIKEAVKNLACTVYAIIYYTATGFVALVLLLSGVKWMTSDDTSGRIEARRRLSYAIVGLIVIILACPLINFFFANTDLVKKGPCDCGNLPFTGGGPGPTPNGVCSADEKTIGVPNSVRCDVSGDCATYDNSECKHYCGGRHICFGKKNVGEDCDPLELYDVNEQKTKWGLICMSNECSNGKCQNNPRCTSSASVSSSEYCGSDNYPKNKKKGEGDSCSASEITSPDNPDLICASNWCTSAGCRPYGQCWTALDCESSFHYGSSRFCNPSINPWSCEIKRGTGKDCKAGDEVNSNANKVCQSNSCTASNKCA